MFLNALLNGIFQVVVFNLIPFLWWLVTARKKESFFSWIGLKKFTVTDKKKWSIRFACILVGGYAIGRFLVFLQKDMTVQQSQYAGMGLSALPSILAYAIIQTSLSEELLFRGFLVKRLAAKMSFLSANLIQGFIFGLLHLILLIGNVPWWYLILATLYPMLFSMAFCWLNEKQSDGSILPGWMIHAAVNILSQLALLF